ncbi:hypothetical protein O181_070530 [Austropuccinia psidii MF-1]|uniref:Uncharacterized protein n=1 Tax=Austropuccinia psidii MF-1 TaxID=1389203 RepID=A0A9Q3I958_9BASI|nr:hypothetical protein [Austropuccinia psidii MF-1]
MIRHIPTSINLSTPHLGHYSIVTSLIDQIRVIIWAMKDGDGKRTFELWMMVTMSCHPWDSSTKSKTHLIPLEKTLPFPVCLASKLRCNPLQAQVGPNSRRTYSASPPNTMSCPLVPPALSEVPASHVPLTENDSTHEPEPDVSRVQSTEDPLGKYKIFLFSVSRIPSPLLKPFPACPTTSH